MAVPSRIADRLASGLKRFQPILESAKARDINESDTSMIVSDILAEIFGYDKYSEVTREMCIRGTYCDLAIKLDTKFQFLIEVKAIGLDLKDAHVKQAVDYAANQGIEWVALTNGAIWRVYKVSFGKPIDQELVLEVNLLELHPKNESNLESLFLLTRESIVKSALDAYHDQRQATNKFFLAAILTGDTVLDVLRRELRRLSPDVRIGTDELREALVQEVLKREVIEGEKADSARKKVQRSANKSLRAKRTKDEDQAGSEDSATVPEAAASEENVE